MIWDQRWWQRPGRARLRATDSRGRVSARATVLLFARLKAFTVAIAEASVADASVLSIAKLSVFPFRNLECFVFALVFPLVVCMVRCRAPRLEINYE
ncbi:hypothetical protein ACH5RR_029873 [Cinchona calisaya]|uniref:Uncharacterized protein n=1 Tax=Cinchona calisaya TaxID=153742 RepID=A0ABD2YW80_9GENT